MIMQKKQIKQSFLSLFSFGLLFGAACSPTPEKREFKNTKPSFQAKSAKAEFTKLQIPTDIKLKIENEELATSRLLKFSTDLYELAPLASSPEISKKLRKTALDTGSAFYSTQGSTYTIPMKESPFVGAAAGSTVTDASQLISGLLQMLDQQEERLLNYLNSNPLKIPADISSLEMMSHLNEHLGALGDFLKSPETNPLVRTEMEAEIKKQSGQRISSAASRLGTLESATTVGGVLDSVDLLVEEFEVTLDAPSQKNYQFGRKLDQLLNKAKTSEDLLEVVVVIWEFYTPSERDQLIKPFSPELYEFLNGQDKDSLDCFAHRKDCDLITYVEKFSVASEIESKGISSVRSKAITAVRNAARNIVRRNVRSALLSLPKKLIEDRVKKKFAEQKKFLAQVIPGYKDLVASIVTNWSKKHLGGLSSLAGFETDLVALTRIQTNETIDLSLSPSLKQNKVLNYSSEQLATAFLASIYKLEASSSLSNSLNAELDPELMLRNERLEYLKLINRLFITGGFKDQTQKLQPSLALKLFAKDPAKEMVDITKFTQTSELMAVPDQLKLSPVTQLSKTSNIMGFEIQSAETSLSLSVRSQARLLKALTKTFFHLRDWEESSFDQSMGQFKVADFLPAAFKVGAFESKLFPKGEMFALAVANAALILNNFNSLHSPLFVVTVKGENHFDRKALAQVSDTEGSKIVMAGAVDLKMTSLERSEMVESEGLSEMILSLADFYEATEEIERTESNSLKPAVGSLLKARQDVISLVQGMGIFLSQKLRSADSGGVLEHYSIESTKSEANKSAIKKDSPSLEKLRTKDQILAMRALLKVSIITGQKGFANFAVDILQSMNKHLYNKELGFYAESSQDLAKAIHWTELPSTLSGLKEISQQLQGENKTQLEALISLWENQLLQINW